MKVTIEVPDGHEIKVVPSQQPSEAAVGSSDGLACAVCGGHKQVKVFGKWLLGTQMPMCFPCFEVWYDGSETETSRIREKSLAAQANATLSESARENQNL